MINVISKSFVYFKGNIMEKIDVCVNVLGKPYQTLITLKTLLMHSSDWIDKIYFIEESQQPIDYDFNFIQSNLNFENLIRHKTKHFFGWSYDRYPKKEKLIGDQDLLESVRYEYGLKNTDKKYMLIIHNDIIFTDDVVKFYMDSIDGEYAGLGRIGQCWNCPMSSAGLCDGEKIFDNIENSKYDYGAVMDVFNKYPPARLQSIEMIDRKKPIPLPECRLNEFCTLINVDLYKKNVIPNGNVHPIGGMFFDSMDTGIVWFREMVELGYKFKHVNPEDDKTRKYMHCYFSEDGTGHLSMLSRKSYEVSELRAKEYLEKHFKIGGS